MIKKSKNIIVPMLMAITALNPVLANEANNITIDDFQPHKIEQTISIDKSSVSPTLNAKENININSNNELFYLKNINGGVTSFDEFYKQNEPSGAFVPHKNSAHISESLMTMTVDSFGRDQWRNLRDTLKEHDLYTHSFRVLRNDLKYYDAIGENVHAYNIEEESNNIDYNHIHLEKSGIEAVQDIIKKNNPNVSEEVLNLIPFAVYVHEKGHTHYRSELFGKSYTKEIRKLRENTNETEVKEFKDFNKAALDAEYVHNENYSDAYSLLMVSKYVLDKYGNNEDSMKIITEFCDGWETMRFDVMRMKAEQNIDNDHFSVFTVQSSLYFIKQNKDFLASLSEENIRDISTVISSESLSHDLTQQVIAFKGDKIYLTKQLGDIVSKDVVGKLQGMMEWTSNTTASFNMDSAKYKSPNKVQLASLSKQQKTAP